MAFSGKRFWVRTALEIVAGFFLLVPPVLIFFAKIVGFGYTPFTRTLFFIALAPWFPFVLVSPVEFWITYPFAFIAGFFLLHTVLARERFPRCLAVLRKVRPVIAALIAGYFVTGLSRVSTGQKILLGPVEGGYADVAVSGFPFKFAIDNASFSGSSGYSVFIPHLVFVNVFFYAALFYILWYLFQRRKKRLQASAHSKPE